MVESREWMQVVIVGEPAPGAVSKDRWTEII
jgi:hypothetical protein